MEHYGIHPHETENDHVNKNFIIKELMKMKNNWYR